MKPLIENGRHGHGPWGPGHGSFMHVGDDTVAVYHATDGPGDGWENRKARMQRVVWTPQGPWMGDGVGVLGGVGAFLGQPGPGGVGGFDGQGGSQKKHGFRGLIQKLRDEL